MWCETGLLRWRETSEWLLLLLTKRIRPGLLRNDETGLLQLHRLLHLRYGERLSTSELLLLEWIVRLLEVGGCRTIGPER